MNDYREYFDEVIHAHQLIEQWFSSQQNDGTLEHLLTRFSPEFSMITPMGKALDFMALTALFQQAGGKRPGFTIQLSELRGIDQHANGATVSYREAQTDGTGLRTARYSTAIFEKPPSGQLKWRHLHETFCNE
ncbi:DUF4440 domain-containing protein [Pseudomonas purpurea]|uniref:DUF4440 domain-containing protein n=1 Tax=Pseudomonas purpurea TaxID=3136737 RepID=UPI003263EEBC